MVFAIEPEPADIALIQANAEAFGVPNVRPVAGRAPDVLATLPEPDAIFVGGTGRQVGLVLSAAYTRLAPGGRMAVNVATIDGLATAHETLKKLAGEVQPLEHRHRPGHRADGPRPLRGDQPDLPPGRDQDGRGRRLTAGRRHRKKY